MTTLDHDPMKAQHEEQQNSPTDLGSASALISSEATSFQFEPLNIPESVLAAFKPQFGPPGNETATIKELAEEIAEDMLRLLERMKRLETMQDQLSEQIGLVQLALQESRKHTVAEISILRQELLGERKAFAVRGAFNAILPTLDALRAMHHALAEAPENAIVRAQLYAIISSLVNVIQSLGFVEFQVETGVSFDPSQMECLGYQEGEPDTVLEMIRPGYKIENAIIRPCGVFLARAPQNTQIQSQ
jgi:molecular chaperone GrpE (heat shock protein)